MFGDFLSFNTAANPVSETDKVRQKVLDVLFDETVTAIPPLQMHEYAALTYHEGQHSAEDDLCEAVVEALHHALNPKQHATTTIITLLKALVLTKHLLVWGAERIRNETQGLKPAIGPLLEYNTALMAQQQNAWYRFKGGAVDEGGPIRDEAQTVLRLLNLSPAAWQQERQRYATDQQRLASLQENIHHQQEIKVMEQKKSNLAKADGGFGGGYSSRDGKTIVGASHSLDEMMALAQKEQAARDAKFSDAPDATNNAAAASGFADYAAPVMGGTSTVTSDHFDTMDLLDMGGPPMGAPPPPPEAADLLDFGVGAPVPSSNNTAAAPADDLLTLSMSATAPTTSSTTTSSHLDPFAASLSVAPSAPAPALGGTQPAVHIGSFAFPTSTPPTTTFDNNYDDNEPQQNAVVAPVVAVSALSNGPSVRVGTTVDQSSRSGIFAAPTSEDPFSAFDTLGGPMSSAPNLQQQQQLPLPDAGLQNATTAMGNMNLSSSANGDWSTPAPISISSGLQVSSVPAPFASSGINDDDNDNGFVMGGSMGTGLVPMTAAPAAPPPPPPGM